jgi:hypothetical protein
MDDLLREAIADAKAVRETALENAKIALEEAFTPRLQSMLSKKIATEMEDSEDSEEEMNREMAEEEAEEMEAEEMMDAEERDDSEMGAEEMKMDADEMEVEDEEAPEEVEMDAEEMEDAEETSHDAEEMEDKEEEDELDLESVLAELEADLNEEEEEDEIDESEKSDKDEEEKVDENDVSSDIGKSDNKVNPKANDSSATGAQGPEGEGKDEPAGNELDDHEVVKEEEEKEDEVEEDIDLDEVLKALSEEEDAEDEADKVEELKKDITETRIVVKFMRATLTEVNLLNAKLLFSNKLFRAFGLNNNQKLKVVENFDRTKNLREVKLVYATLAESFKSPKKLSESVSKGSSSKPVASTKPANEEVLTEGNELKARFKKLANIL